MHFLAHRQLLLFRPQLFFCARDREARREAACASRHKFGARPGFVWRVIWVCEAAGSWDNSRDYFLPSQGQSGPWKFQTVVCLLLTQP